ncbi:DUF1302 domain-containing protein [Pandoraea pneumonica]|uniref:DUF1302 domain-containing protein n=1 Tax=Pandoraea pneumonica TaxID=2508299 RepID=UPI003CE88AFA
MNNRVNAAKRGKGRGTGRLRRERAWHLSLATACLYWAVVPTAGAFEFDTGNPDFKIRWDNTLKYSTAWRVQGQNNALLVDPNMDDGDRNFNKGLISNRVDLLSEFDASYRDFGVRVSGAAWYDTVYNRANDNNSPATANQTSVANNQFTNGTRDLSGRKVELLDAFVHGRVDLGDLPTSFRLGRHTVLYGETLFFGGNGIAGAQAPVDIIKLLTVPSTQFKELLMPVNQLSGQVQLNSNVSLGAYYQFEWRANRIPPAGSYLSNADLVGAGAERMFAPGTDGQLYFNRTQDMEAKNSGQGGMQLRFRPDSEIAEFGLYAVRYHAKDFQLYLNPAQNPAMPSLGTYQQVYPEGIVALGASMSTTVGGANVAAEISTRRNTPLTSNPTVGIGFDNAGHPAYAVGNSAHANLSAIYLLDGTPMWNGGSILAEVAWNRMLSVTKNSTALSTTSTRDAVGLRILFAPEYYQIFPGIDMTVPIGVGYLASGRSSVDPQFAGGAEHGGDLSIGFNFDYRKQVKFGINYVHYFGGAGTYLTPNQSAANTALQYQQSLKDRDFVSLSMQATF